MNSRCARSRRFKGARRWQWFSLIELLIVVAIVLIIAAIAIPNYLRSKMLANEASATQSVRSIATAEYVYFTTYGMGYSNTLLDLGGGQSAPSSTTAGLIDDPLSSGVKTGYSFTYTPASPNSVGSPQTYTLNAQPVVPGSTGARYFYVDQTGVIRQNSNGPAGNADPPL